MVARPPPLVDGLGQLVNHFKITQFRHLFYGLIGAWCMVHGAWCMVHSAPVGVVVRHAAREAVERVPGPGARRPGHHLRNCPKLMV